MPEVARVIHNRLARAAAADGLDRPLRHRPGRRPGDEADLEIQSPYNTYLNNGLPPRHLHAVDDRPGGGPASAGGAWLYFTLVEKNGTMAFSDTYAGQLANEKLAQSRGLP